MDTDGKKCDSSRDYNKNVLDIQHRRALERAMKCDYQLFLNLLEIQEIKYFYEYVKLRDSVYKA